MGFDREAREEINALRADLTKTQGDVRDLRRDVTTLQSEVRELRQAGSLAVLLRMEEKLDDALAQAGGMNGPEVEEVNRRLRFTLSQLKEVGTGS